MVAYGNELQRVASVIDRENNGTVVLSAYNRIPYGLINEEIDSNFNDVLTELTEICGYYDIYKNGVKFNSEGTNGDYLPSTLRYKLVANLINKEARFLFAEPPTISVDPKGDAGEITDEARDNLNDYNDLIRTVLDENNFEEKLIKAAKDCFIGKRVACLVNFNEVDGVTVTFLPATQFIYETRPGNPNVINKFVAFIIIRDSVTLNYKRIFKKKYTLEDDVVYLEENLYDGAGKLVEEVTPKQETLLNKIPVAVFVNDGLTSEIDGESEVTTLKNYEQLYNKLSNADVDAERKSMNPIIYAIDLDSRSTKNLSRAAGSFWDLGTDQNLDEGKVNVNVGMLEPGMRYSDALKTTLERVKTASFDQLDIPNINLETMSGQITSGKALKAIYWPLIVRCKEKMKTWGPQLQNIIEIIIDGALVYPNTCERYVNKPLVPVDYEVSVEQNTPLPEDEAEEKTLDMSEVSLQTMSRKSYMKKWRDLSDVEVEDELQQIALERQILEDAFNMPSTGDIEPYYPDDSGAAFGDNPENENENAEMENTENENEDVEAENEEFNFVGQS